MSIYHALELAYESMAYRICYKVFPPLDWDFLDFTGINDGLNLLTFNYKGRGLFIFKNC